MKLNMITIVDENKKERKNEPLNLEMHFVMEIFRHYLKRIELDGSKKLSIHFNDNEEKKYTRDSYFHISIYYVENEKIQYLQKVKQSERPEAFLNILVETLIDIANINKCEDNVIEQINTAKSKVLKSKFELEKEIKKYAINEGNRKLRVYRKINKEGEMWYLRVQQGKEEIKEYKMLPKPIKLSQEHVFDKCVCNGNVVTFYEKFGRKLIEIDLDM